MAGAPDPAIRLFNELAEIRQEVRELSRLIGAVVAGRPSQPDLCPITWVELWPLYAEAESDKLESWGTVVGRAKHVLRLIGSVRVMETTIATMRGYRSARRGETTVRKKLTTPKTRNNEIELIRRMARWASRQKPPIIPLDPLGNIDRCDLFEPTNNARLNVVEDADPRAPLGLKRLLRKADELDTAIVLVAHSSGMRRAEIARLEWSWIDLRPGVDGKPLRIVEIPPGIAKGRPGKRDGRQTFISSEALAAIERYRATLPLPMQRLERWVFCNPETGKHFHKDHLTVRFAKLQQRAGLVGPSGPLWLHDLRRSFITLARRRGEEVTNIMAASGHETLEAFQRYNIHARRDAIIVRDRIERARAIDEGAFRRRGPRRASSSSPARVKLGS
jgi:integrase